MVLDPQKTVFLIDGSSFLYRAYYGTRPLHTSKGEPVNAVYSFCRMIKKLSQRFNVRFMSLVWDSKGKTTRHTLYEAYKATRQEAPSDLFDQKKRIQDFAQLIGLTQHQQVGYEADDLMYSCARELQEQGMSVVYVTSDKDMGQALTDSSYMYDYFKDVLRSKEETEQVLGFSVAKIPFYFALLGDSTDNIPGVRGIGKKTAQELVEQFDSLDHLYASLDTIEKPRIAKALMENKDNAYLSYDLFLLHYVPQHVTADAVAFSLKNWDKAQPFFQELEFVSLLKTMNLSQEQSEVQFEHKKCELEQKNLRLVSTVEQLQDVIEKIYQTRACALDTETNGLDLLQARLVGISVSVHPNEAYYIPCGHTTGQLQLSLALIRDMLAPVLQDTSIAFYFHNAKFDLHVLNAHDLPVHDVAFDTLVAASLITRDWQRIGLKHVSQYYFNEPMLTFEEVVKQQGYHSFEQVPLELATLYAAYDARQTLKLVHLFKEELEKEGMTSLFYDIEMPLMKVLYMMERNGIFVDQQKLAAIDQALAHALTTIEENIRAFLGTDYKDLNLNSPRQIEQLLFHDLQLPPQKKSGKGLSYSTDQEVLESLAELHPVPGLLLKYRELFKLQSTYVKALPEYISARDGKVHTTFSQTRVATGRLASFNPNLQNVPASGIGVTLRSVFTPAESMCFISADYSQIELRVLAHLSQDPTLQEAFTNGHDIHKETAARLCGVSLDEVTHEQRQIGKRINFSILYGLTPYGLSKDIGISFAEAKKYIDTYFAQYPRVKIWMESIVSQAACDGFVTTQGGRRRYIPAIYEKNKVLYQEAVRVAINTVAQGTAAEIMKRGMIELDKRLKQEYPRASIVLQIHDELVITAPCDQKDQIEQMVKRTLETVVDWNTIPLVVSTRSGSDWKEVSK